MIEGKIFVGFLLCMLTFNVKGLGLQIWTKTRFNDVIVLKHFWKSTGLSPSSEREFRKDFLLSDDEKLNLDFIGALPNEAITKIRIHWLLDLITVSEGEAKKPIFHLENLDRLIDRLYRRGLSPSFELMGNPSNYFHNFRTQSNYWISLIKKIINRYSNLYNADYVRGWRFELMNEPDLKQYNTFNFTLKEYIDYFKASEAAVPGLAGPAGLFRANRKAHSLCWGFLNYCNSNPCRLNMITFHRKGGQVGSEVVSEGLELINTLISDYPNLKGVPFGNDEADILVGWQKPLEWRADVRYAALVVQVIIGHIEEMFVKRNIPFEALSNDNAFLSFSPNYFTQRTLLARFQMNNTKPVHVQFFRKPVYSVMGLLSLLGPYLKDVRYHPVANGFSYLMTSHRYQDTFLGVITEDRVTNETYVVSNATLVDVTFKIALGNRTVSGICVGYLMDNNRSSPYQIWRDGGSPNFPDLALRRKMREAETFKRVFIRKVRPHQSQMTFVLRDVMVPSVLAFHVCFEGTHEPGQVTELHYAKVTQDEIILFWKDTKVNSRCILTYEIEFKKIGDADFKKINYEDFIFLSYHHSGVDKNGIPIGVIGDYRVTAVDYWNRRGPSSDVLSVKKFNFDDHSQYAPFLRRAKELPSMGITQTKIRWGRDRSLLLETNGDPESADNLAQALRDLAEQDEFPVQIHRPCKKGEITLEGLDITMTKREILTELSRQTNSTEN